MFKSRVAAVAVGTTILALGATGGAIAAGEITSYDIKNDSVKSRDIQDNTLRLRDIRDTAEEKLRGQQGEQGPAGPKGDTGPQGPQGEPGLSNIAADGPYNSTWEGDEGATLQTAEVACEEGQYATGGGFSGQGGADDTDAPQTIEIVASYPYFDGEYEPVNERGSFRPTKWVVKGYNNGTADQVVRPWVICADAAE